MEDCERHTEAGAANRVISDFGMPLYVVAKHPDGLTENLSKLWQAVKPEFPAEGFFVHQNDNNLSVVPTCISKRAAVEYLLNGPLNDGPRLVIGAGDSLSDAEFLRVCDFLRCAWSLTAHADADSTVSRNDPSMTDVDSASDSSWHNGALPQTTGQPISGSYDPADVLFLLKCVQVSDTPVPLKEQLIQSGARHYSEMITRENPPGEQYLRLFYRAFEANRERLARDLITLAQYLNTSRSGPLTLVSLARAGTPIGAILKRWILRSTSRTPDSVSHYSISLIRDRGIDQNALKWILERHSPESIVFIDGWTGKGVMARELRTAIKSLDRDLSHSIDDRLMVIADLCGAAGFAATCDDYLIPSSLLGATISGLVSRSIRNADVTGVNDFDGCIEYLSCVQTICRAGSSINSNIRWR